MKLFQSIFGGGETVGSYPESLIEMATERAVDGTDSRLRFLPGCRKRLRKPVIQAIDHVVALVDGISAFVPASRKDHGAEPRLAAVFASAEAMQDAFGRDPALAHFLSSSDGARCTRVTALLLAERMERNILGMDLVGDRVQQDVSHSDHICHPCGCSHSEGFVAVGPAADFQPPRRTRRGQVTLSWTPPHTVGCPIVVHTPK